MDDIDDDDDELTVIQPWSQLSHHLNQLADPHLKYLCPAVETQHSTSSGKRTNENRTPKRTIDTQPDPGPGITVSDSPTTVHNVHSTSVFQRVVVYAWALIGKFWTGPCSVELAAHLVDSLAECERLSETVLRDIKTGELVSRGYRLDHMLPSSARLELTHLLREFDGSPGYVVSRIQCVPMREELSATLATLIDLLFGFCSELVETGWMCCMECIRSATEELETATQVQLTVDLPNQELLLFALEAQLRRVACIGDIIRTVLKSGKPNKGCGCSQRTPSRDVDATLLTRTQATLEQRIRHPLEWMIDQHQHRPQDTDRHVSEASSAPPQLPKQHERALVGIRSLRGDLQILVSKLRCVEQAMLESSHNDQDSSQEKLDGAIAAFEGNWADVLAHGHQQWTTIARRLVHSSTVPVDPIKTDNPTTTEPEIDGNAGETVQRDRHHDQDDQGEFTAVYQAMSNQPLRGDTDEADLCDDLFVQDPVPLNLYAELNDVLETRMPKLAPEKVKVGESLTAGQPNEGMDEMVRLADSPNEKQAKAVALPRNSAGMFGMLGELKGRVKEREAAREEECFEVEA